MGLIGTFQNFQQMRFGVDPRQCGDEDADEAFNGCSDNPTGQNGFADPTRLLCLPLAQLSSRTHSPQGRSNKTSARFWMNICVLGKLPNHHCAQLHVLHVVHTKTSRTEGPGLSQ
eukprot:9499583-Ditylum_brightwellii.AAC.1